MADLAASAVTFESRWNEGGISGKRKTCARVRLTLTGQGGATNRILASVFGMRKIEEATNFVTSDNASIYVAAPSQDGTILLLANLAQATDDNRDDPADVTSVTLVGTVKGYQ